MLTMFFGKRNKFKVFILWRVRAELNFSFLSYDLVYTWNCVSAAVLVWWWQTVSGMTTIIGIHLLGIMNIHTKSHKDVGSSWWGILQLMNSKLIDQQRRPAGWARSQKRNVLPAGVGWGNKIKKCSTSGESDILTELLHFHISCVHVKPFRSDGNRAKIIGIHPLGITNINKGVDPPWRVRVRDNCYILIYLVYMWIFWSDGGRRGEKWWSWLSGFILWGPRIFTINLQTCVSRTWCRLWSLYNISLHRNTSVALAGFQGVFLWSGPTVKHAGTWGHWRCDMPHY